MSKKTNAARRRRDNRNSFQEEVPMIFKKCRLKHGTIKHVTQCRKMNGFCAICEYYY